MVATHSPILLGFPGSTIYELEDEAIRVVRWEDTAPVRDTRRFLLDRERTLRRVLDEG